MAESIADRYRTRFPPKEHEEAVRMLLEGVESQRVEETINNNNNNNHQRHHHQRKMAPSTKTRDNLATATTQREAKQQRDRRMIPNDQYYLTSQTNQPVNKNHHHYISSPPVASSLNNNNNNVDRRSLYSSSTATEHTNSSSEVVESNNNSDSGTHLQRHLPVISNGTNATMMQQSSKSTSTSESISFKGSSSADSSETRSMSMAMFPASAANDNIAACDYGHDASSQAAHSGDDDLIPSRTIAVQCDLKWSSVKSRDQLFDTSMQASSISSTKYGFYNYNYETLAKRHLIQRSTSYGNLNNNNNNNNNNDDDDDDATINRLSNGYNNNKEIRSLAPTDAPTSMSELSDNESGVEDDEKISHDHSRKQLSSTQNLRRGKSSLKSTSRMTSNNQQEQQLPRERSREYNPSLSTTKGRQMYGSVMDNSTTLSTSRARINSLPRRPMTALSYVSANKLRHQQQQQQQSDTESSDQDVRDVRDVRDDRANTDIRGATQRKPSLNRARKLSSVSHQNLVRPKQVLASSNGNHQFSSSNASSDSELNRVTKTNSSRNQNNHLNRVPYDENFSDDADADVEEENRRSEEMILTNGTKVSLPNVVHNLKPKVIGTTRHQEEEVQDLNGMLEQFRRAESELRNNGPTNNATRVYKYSTLKPNVSSAISREDKEEGGGEEGEEERSRFVGSTMSLPRKVTRRSHAGEITPAMRRRQPINLAKNKTTVTRDGLSRAHEASERGRSQVGRSTSMRQVPSSGPADTLRRYVQPIQQQQHLDDEDQDQNDDDDDDDEYDDKRHNNQQTQLTRQNRSQTMRPTNRRAPHLLVHDDDSDTLQGKTWSNPSGVSFGAQKQNQTRSTKNNVVVDDDQHNNDVTTGNNFMASARKGASRSMSMRDITNDGPSIMMRYAHKTGTTPSADAATTRQKYINPSYRSSDSNNFTAKYNDATEYSSSESSDLVAANENIVHNLAARLSPLDYDSQQRLNESGLPEVRTDTTSTTTATHRANSHLGHHTRMNAGHRHHSSQDGLQQQQLQQQQQQQQLHNKYTSNTLNGRGSLATQIKGRAMSQQSLTRPTMPHSANGRGRLQQTASGSISSEHVGGSSMSLATRLQGRYESAHTRSPIVMYIPPANSSSRASSLKGGDDSVLGGGAKSSSSHRSTTLKRGSSRSPRNRSRHGSQDRSSAGTMQHRRQRSSSRNGSDSETSSILRTLVRSRGRESAYSSKRIARMHNLPVNNMIDTDDENMDGVGRLATEVDSYKFIRRYSVPKDAKINWFARLRQRVASGNR